MSTENVPALLSSAASNLPATIDGPDANVVPASHAEYTWQAPNGFEIEKTPHQDNLRQAAKEMGLTQRQYRRLMQEAVRYEQSRGVELFDAHVKAGAKQTEGELRQAWGGEYEGKLAAASSAWNAFADPSDLGKVDLVGNNPVVLRLLANVAAKMNAAGGGRVDPPATDEIPKDQYEELMRDREGPYWNREHPRHTTVTAAVKRHHEAAARRRGPQYASSD